MFTAKGVAYRLERGDGSAQRGEVWYLRLLCCVLYVCCTCCLVLHMLDVVGWNLLIYRSEICPPLTLLVEWCESHPSWKNEELMTVAWTMFASQKRHLSRWLLTRSVWTVMSNTISKLVCCNTDDKLNMPYDCHSARHLECALLGKVLKENVLS